jgi:hypothetical protein
MSALAASTIYNDNETLKEFPDAPSYWKADLQRSIESNMRLLAELDREFLVDLKFAGTREKAIEVFRQLLFRYIQAFELWPEIRESMTDFNLVSAERV